MTVEVDMVEFFIARRSPMLSEKLVFLDNLSILGSICTKLMLDPEKAIDPE